MVGGGSGILAVMKLLREESSVVAGWRDVQSLVVLMIGCLCTDAGGREVVSRGRSVNYVSVNGAAARSFDIIVAVAALLKSLRCVVQQQRVANHICL